MPSPTVLELSRWQFAVTAALHTARGLLLTLRESDLSMTLVLTLHDQQVGQVSWTPDTVVRLRRPGPAATQPHAAGHE
jgi:hypothetical protein